jgi:hypothetical protein
MSKLKKEQKQFVIETKEDCIIYLKTIIGKAELCLSKLKEYNKQTEEILDDNKNYERGIIAYELYGEISDKIANVISYLLNILGDAQSISISYFKYRKLVEKLIEKQVAGIVFAPFTDELNDICIEFNKMRNWYNHVPESLLVSELELIRKGIYHKTPIDPIEIYIFKSVEYAYVKEFYIANLDFYKNARRLVQACKRDYSKLIGKNVTLKKVYIDKPVNFAKNQAARMSAEVQGLIKEN